jgi:transposase
MSNAVLPNDPKALKAILADRDEYISELQEQVRWLKAVIHAATSERRAKPNANERQYSLFDEAEAVAAEFLKADDSTVAVPSHTRRKRGRRPIPPTFPRVEVVHDLPEEDKTCPCGSPLTRIGEEVSEKVDFIPAKIQVVRHVRPKYACRECEGVEDDSPTVKIAPMPPQVIPKGIATPGLLAYVLASKFVDGLPFYRQERMFARLGLDVSRSTMCGWALRVAEACEPIMGLLHEEILSGPVLNLDETTVQVLKEPGRKNTSKSYMWLARGGPPGKPGVLFHYSPSRSGKIAEELVRDFSGYLQTDGYAGYNALGEREGIIHVGCMAHVRRKFMDVLKAGTKKRGTAQEVVDLIAQLYGLEKQARQAGFDADRILAMRQNQSRQIMDTIKALLLERGQPTPPKSLLGRAIAYALGQWERVETYLEDGILLPDNNLAENAIRPFAVGRKNWLFSGSPRGAAASAALYSLVETAKANGLEPLRYLHFLFEELPGVKSDDERRSLLPQYLAPEELV